MSEEVKKISFGFSKLAKPKVSIITNNKDIRKEESVQFIDCVEDKSIKVKNEEPKKPDFLIIPLPKQSSGNIKNSDLLGKILNNSDISGNLKTEEKGEKTSNPSISTESSKVSNRIESIDEIAAREIIEDLKKNKDEKEEQNNFSVPLTTNAPSGEKESSLDDYESIPIDKFGVAMLRGMGWVPGKGIGKNEKVVDAKQPVLRPKGLGLGADKVIKKEETQAATDEPIKLVKGSCVRIIAGAHKDLFGEIIGFDDEAGRLIVKMALGGSVLTFNEFMVQPISKEDFSKNSRVINVKKFEEYKSKEDSKGVIENTSRNTSHKSSDLNTNKKSVYKTNKHRGSSVSSNDSAEEKKVQNSQSKSSSHKSRYKSRENSSNVELKSKKYRSSSADSSPEVHRTIKYESSSTRKEYSKSKYYDSPDRSTSRNYSKYTSHKESFKFEKHRSSHDSSPSRTNSKSYDKRISRKDLPSKNKSYRSSSHSSSAERYSSSKRKESKRSVKRSESSDSDHSYRRRKDVSPEIKKKSRRRSSSSDETKQSKRSSSHKKHKKNKKSKYDR